MFHWIDIGKADSEQSMGDRTIFFQGANPISLTQWPASLSETGKVVLSPTIGPLAATQKPKPISIAMKKSSLKKPKAKVFIFLANERKLFFFIIFSVRFIMLWNYTFHIERSTISVVSGMHLMFKSADCYTETLLWHYQSCQIIERLTKWLGQPILLADESPGVRTQQLLLYIQIFAAKCMLLWGLAVFHWSLSQR